MNEKAITSREDETAREAPHDLSPRARKKLEALRKLQASVKARGVDLAAWEREVRAIRRESSIKRMSIFDDLS